MLNYFNFQEWFEKFEFLQFEVNSITVVLLCLFFIPSTIFFQFNRFHLYLGTLHSNIIMDYNGPLPTGLVPSPSISTLATTGTSEDLGHLDYRRRSRESSPLPPLVRDRKESSPAFPLTSTSRVKR